jgi:Pyruvate/2-oxoacid:ferredoxin oxidoreductase delta subunit
MSLKEQETVRVVFYEGAGSDPGTGADRYEHFKTLLNRGFSVTRATGNGEVAAADRAHLLVLGRFQGAATPAFEDANSGAAITVREIGRSNAQELADWVESARSSRGSFKHGDWKPWFPVIDYDRCTNCMQCLSFCLFGVYGVDAERQIQVQNNDNCKTNCPACSRVCPEAAIMFPKYKAGPINGDQVSDADLQREKMKIDISALLGGDVYQMLRDRSERAKSRFSKERDSEKALAERQKCLVKLGQLAADIPPEVLLALPSPEEIQRRAEDASRKAKEALEPLS